jgi:AraC-like DNA-binding protein
MTFAPTLGAALADFVNFQIDNSRGAAAYLHRMGEDFGFGIGVYDPGYRASSLAYDLAFAVGCSMIRYLTEGKVEPVEGLLLRRAPEDTASYRQAARCPVRFDQPQCCIILPAHSMEYRLRSADPVRHAELLKQLSERLSRAPWGIAGQVRHVLRPLLLLGKDSLPEIADAMGLHLRTLERHLQQEGTSFGTLKSDVRFALARDLLSLTNLPAGEIATSLGYGSHSSFVHAFQRWAGTSPTKWRKAVLSSTAS